MSDKLVEDIAEETAGATSWSAENVSRETLCAGEGAEGAELPGELARFISDGTCADVVARYAALPAQAAAADYGELDRNIVVIDTETTGFSLSHDELTQIAAARMERGEIVDWFITFVNPGKPIPDDVAHLTNIHDEDVADAPLPAEALAQLVEFVGDAKVVAHNAEFDRNFTTKHPAGYPLLENQWLDSLDLARIALPRMKSHRLIDLVRAFGAPLSTHRADEDVAATCALFRILLAGVDAMPEPLVREIAKMAPADQWPTVAVFDYFARRKAQEGLEIAPDLLEGAPATADVSRETPGAAQKGGAVQGEGVLQGEDAVQGAPNGSLAAAPRDEFDVMFGVPPAAPAATAGTQLSAFAPAAERFSLRAMRRERLRGDERRAKLDADAIAEDPYRELRFPTQQDVAEAFTAEGMVGGLYDDYEPREEQRVMAEAVRHAFDSSRNLMVEAGTGVGKSMAYLVPATMTSLINNVTVGVATKTNALLDQLVHHELPALAEALAARGQELTFTSLKGFSHYPCLHRIERIVEEGPRLRTVGNKEYPQAPALAALLSFIEQTDYDDLDGLKIDYRVLPRRSVTTTSHDCLRRKCPFYGTSCFVHGARRRAETANVVVTNHSLLFCDLAADNGLLPPIRYWVVDEAHGAENEARRAFSIEMSADDIRFLARRVAGDESSRNVFSRAERAAVVPGREEGATLFYALANKARSAGQAFAEAAEPFCEALRGLLFFDTNRRGKGYEVVELWINADIRSSATWADVVEKGRAMADRAEKLVTACQEMVALLEDAEGAAVVQREIASIALELKDIMRAVEVILVTAPDTYVYAATLSRKGDRPVDQLTAMPFNVGAALDEMLYANTHSVVFASATLTVGDSFAAFEGAMGLNTSEASACDALLLASSYDFDAHMRVFVASDMPEPNDPRYLEVLERLLVGTHRAQRGSMLTLFTNRREMEKSFEAVQPALKKDDLRLVCQKWGVSVKGLRDDFLADEHLSLFALKSFWEGFDAPGATLKGVIIPKLPFAKPTDPLSCERGARDDAAWRRYVLPAAVMETKQAAGRLIRKADDEGVLILADKRLVTKGYGKSFLKSLPSRNITVCTIDEIIAALEQAS